MIQQPTFFTPVQTNYIKEKFSLSDFIPSNTQSNTASMPSMKASQSVSMTFISPMESQVNQMESQVNPMESHSDSVTVIN
jgi:hypothetical protein